MHAGSECCIHRSAEESFVFQAGAIENLGKIWQRSRNREVVMDGTGSFQQHAFVTIVQESTHFRRLQSPESNNSAELDVNIVVLRELG